MEEKFKPQPYVFTIKTDEAITFVYNPKLKDKVPESVQKAVEAAKAKIVAGELKVNRPISLKKIRIPGHVTLFLEPIP